MLTLALLHVLVKMHIIVKNIKKWILQLECFILGVISSVLTLQPLRLIYWPGAHRSVLTCIQRKSEQLFLLIVK